MSAPDKMPLLRAQLNDIEDAAKKCDSLYGARICQIIEDIRAEMVSALTTPPDRGSVERIAEIINKTEGCNGAPVSECDFCARERPDSCMSVAKAVLAAIPSPSTGGEK